MTSGSSGLGRPSYAHLGPILFTPNCKKDGNLASSANQTASLVLTVDDWDSLRDIQYERDRSSLSLNVRANIAVRDERVCLVTAGREIVSLCLVSAGGYAGDLDRRIELRVVRILDKPVNWHLILDEMAGSITRFASEASMNTRILSERTGVEVVRILSSVSQEADRIYTDLRAQQRTFQQRPLDSEGQLREEQRDAIAIALRAAGLDSAAMLESTPNNESTSFLSSLDAEAAPASEAALIRHDFSRFAHWLPSDGRLHDVVEFRDPNDLSRRVEVFYADKEALELATGTDLIYHRVNEQAWVLVQYKRMKKVVKDGDAEDWFYRTDDQLKTEIDRMRRVPVSPLGLSADSWRLNPEPFYVKLVRDRTARPQDRSLLPGMYFPLSYFERLLTDPRTETRGQSRLIGYHNAGRHMTNTDFTALLSDAWIGSSGETTETLKDLVAMAITGGRSAVVALDHTPAPDRPQTS